MSVVNFINKFDSHRPGMKGKNVLEIIREELSVWLVPRSEMFHDYQIWKEIHNFLEEHGGKVPERAGGTNLLLTRVITNMWPYCENKRDNERVISLGRS